MSGFNPTPVDGTTPTPIPMSSVIVPGDKTPRAVRGGPAVVDSQTNTIAGVAMYTYDGDNETLGAKANAAVTDATQTASEMSFIKGFVKILADAWDSVNHWLQVKVMNTVSVSGSVSVSNLPATQVVSAASLPLPTGAATEAGHLATIDSHIPALGQALAGASVPVVLTAAQQTALTPPAAITGFALEAGHLSSIDTHIPAQGQALAGASMPVVLPATQITTLTPPAAITNFAQESGGNLATLVTQTLAPNVSDRWTRQLGQVDIARVLGAALSASNPVIQQNQYIAMALAGKAYCASSGEFFSGTGNVGIALFNNSLTKTIVIYAIPVFNLSNAQFFTLARITSYTAFDTVLTPVASSAGGAASGITSSFCSYSGNTFASLTGLISDRTLCAALGQTVDLIAGGAPIVLPPSAANGVVAYCITAAGQKLGFNLLWFEY